MATAVHNGNKHPQFSAESVKNLRQFYRLLLFLILFPFILCRVLVCQLLQGVGSDPVKMDGVDKSVQATTVDDVNNVHPSTSEYANNVK